MKLTLLFTLCFLCLTHLYSIENVPEILMDYISELSSETSYIPIVPPQGCPDSIPASQAQKDIEMIHYLFNNAYSGKDYWEKKGVSFEKIYQSLNKLLKENEWIKVGMIEEILYKGLENIQDGHLSIRGIGRYSFFSHQDAYFSNILIEKQQSGLKVIYSDLSAVPVGCNYEDKQEFLFQTLSSVTKKHFLLGILSNKYQKSHSWKFSSGIREIPLHPCRLKNVKNAVESVFEFTHIENIPVIRAKHFNSKFHEDLVKFSNCGKKLKNEKVFILSVVNNGGGSSDYPRDFFQNLNNVAHWWKLGANIESPPVIESWARMQLDDQSPYLRDTILDSRTKLISQKQNPVKKWNVWISEDEQKKGDFKGKCIVISNRNVASSGEAAISYSKSVPDSLIIGENSSGIGTFGEVCEYQLPYSRIILNLPSKIFLSPYSEEGRGFLPDYWLDSDTPEQEIVKWIKNPESYQFIPQKITRISRIDFETSVEDFITPLEKSVGAYIGNEHFFTSILRDTDSPAQGKSSLRLSNTLETQKFYSLETSLPETIKKIVVTFKVKGESIEKQGKQFNNCYVGFVYTSPGGRKKFVTESFRGTFPWKTDSVTLNVEETQAREISFNIFHAISGSLLIDDIHFEYTE